MFVLNLTDVLNIHLHSTHLRYLQRFSANITVNLLFLCNEMIITVKIHIVTVI